MERRFRLSPTEYKKLCMLVKDRDHALQSIYREYLGETPPYGSGEIHHVIHKGSGGPDKESNLVLLSYGMHRFRVHGDSWETVKAMTAKLKEYLQCPEVERWREAHADELETIYATEEEGRLRRIRKFYEQKH